MTPEEFDAIPVNSILTFRLKEQTPDSRDWVYEKVELGLVDINSLNRGLLTFSSDDYEGLRWTATKSESRWDVLVRYPEPSKDEVEAAIASIINTISEEETRDHS